MIIKKKAINELKMDSKIIKVQNESYYTLSKYLKLWLKSYNFKMVSKGHDLIYIFSFLDILISYYIW